jgi:hypothetical protein
MELEARHASPIGKSRLTGGLQNTLTVSEQIADLKQRADHERERESEREESFE